MKCGKCGKNLVEGVKFCKYCGSLVSDKSFEKDDNQGKIHRSKICSNCGKELLEGGNFCKYCGSAASSFYNDREEKTLVNETECADEDEYSPEGHSKKVVSIVIAMIISIIIVAGAGVLFGLFMGERLSVGIKTDDENEEYPEEMTTEAIAEETISKNETLQKSNIREEPDEKQKEGPEKDGKILVFAGCIDEYMAVIDQYESAHASNEGNLTYDLIWFDNDECPELVAGLDDYYVSMYIYDNQTDTVKCVIDDWPYGAMGNVGYEYIPHANVMKNINSDFAGLIGYTSFSHLSSTDEIEEFTILETHHFKDLDGDGKPMLEEEVYTDEPEKYYDMLSDREISKNEYHRLMHYGNFEKICGKYSAEEIKTKMEHLSDTNEFDAITGYEIYIEDCTWEEAFDDCKKKGGHLASFEKAEEWKGFQEILKTEGLANISLYIGGRREPGEEQYKWIDMNGDLGDTIVNSSTYDGIWLNDEPSFQDSGIDEYYMDILYKKKDDNWYFNDIPNDLVGVSQSFSGKIGYICEYDCNGYIFDNASEPYRLKG